MRKHLIVAITLVLALGLMQSVAFAEKRGGYDQGRHHRKSIKEKLFKTVRMIYHNQDELNVNDNQLNQIRELKIALKKDSIRKKAEIEIIAVDIRSLLYEDEMDVYAVSRLIDQKYEIKKANMKKVVKSFAELKHILTKEQKEKLKEVISEKREMHMSKGSPKRGLRN
jgi:Spy/CpxP family protein refolding chaperone